MAQDEENVEEHASAEPTYYLLPIITDKKPDFDPQCLESFDHFEGRSSGFGVVFHFVTESLIAPINERW
jgi:hypothetical protein